MPDLECAAKCAQHASRLAPADAFRTGGMRYPWDELNRATSICGTASGARYQYRADGMRVLKVEGLTLSWNGDQITGSGYYDEVWAVNKPTTRYYYDGQMAVEDDYSASNGIGTDVTVVRYGIGARGIEYMSKHFNGVLQLEGFPLYDGHGNMCLTASRSGSGFSVADQRSYDAWGSVRSQSSVDPPNGPKARYCANLGHVQDDESGLLYMRARYYEPWTGRFVSEDPARSGANWYVYAKSNPISFVDDTGTVALSGVFAFAGFIIGFLSSFISAGFGGYSFSEMLLAGLAGGIGGAVAGAIDGLNPAFGAGAGSFVSSLMADMLHGRTINWNRAFVAAGIGGVSAAVIGVVCSVGARNIEVLAALKDLDDYDNGIAIGVQSIVDNGFDSFY